MSDGMVDQARQNVIYMSRRQLKKHTSTVINFSLNVRFISQQVNMPLLRLLHQICNMYQNVKDAQNEFHEHPELSKKSHTKDECSLGKLRMSLCNLNLFKIIISLQPRSQQICCLLLQSRIGSEHTPRISQMSGMISSMRP